VRRADAPTGPTGPIPGQGAPAGSAEDAFDRVSAPGSVPGSASGLEEAEFDARLRAMQERTEGQRAALEAQRAAGPYAGSAAGVRGVLGGASGDAIDYGDVPTGGETLTALGRAARAAGRGPAPGGGGSGFGSGPTAAQGGPSAKLAGGAATIVLIAVLVATSGAFDVAGAGRRSGGSGAAEAPALSKEERDDREREVARLRARVASDPADAESLEALAVSLAELGDYPAASRELERLLGPGADDAAGRGLPTAAAARAAGGPGADPEAWRLLGEVRALGGDARGAVPAFERSIAVSDGGRASLEQLQGLAGSLAAAGRDADAAAVVRAEIGDPASRLGDVEARLLLGKVYASSKGRAEEAERAYADCVAAHPEDYRAHLARGLWLRDSANRRGDAQRSFVQARFYAPEAARPLVDRIAGKTVRREAIKLAEGGGGGGGGGGEAP